MWRKYFKKKRLIRATTLTLCLFLYWFTVGAIFGEVRLVGFIFMVLFCVVMDSALGKALKSKKLAKYFYEEG